MITASLREQIHAGRYTPTPLDCAVANEVSACDVPIVMLYAPNAPDGTTFAAVRLDFRAERLRVRLRH